MNDFIKKMLEHGAELDQAVNKTEMSMIINDAEILYRKHLAELNLLNMPVVRSSVKKTILIDDTWYAIEIDGKDTRLVSEFEFAEILKILLTDKQLSSFVMVDTNREFEVSQKRIDKMFAYINSDKNPWRKQR